MSRKISAFRAINVAPKTTCNYLIRIPNILTSFVNIETSSIPSTELITSSFFVNGMQYSLPVKKKMSGDWSCTMYENMFLSTTYQVLRKQHLDTDSYDGTFNTIFNVRLQDIYIYLTDEITGYSPVACCILKDCFLKKVSEVKLNSGGATEQMKVQLDFTYNGIKDCYVMAKDILGATGAASVLTLPTMVGLKTGVAAAKVKALEDVDSWLHSITK